MARLPEAFYARDARVVALELLGRWLVRDEVTVRITEVEAYLPDDTACHARFGKTARTAPMFGPPGRAYVYLCYGMHAMLNVVTSPQDVPAAVLVRACAPVHGLATIARRRGNARGPALLAGPGRVGAALGLDVQWSGHPLVSPGGLELHEGEPVPRARILAGPRVGIDYASPRDRRARWRYAEAGSEWVSRPAGLTRFRAGHPAKRTVE